MIDLYPEITTLGSLAQVLRLAVGGADFNIQGYDEMMSGSRYWASVKRGNRTSDICTALDERAFIAPLWHLGVQLASIDTPDVEELAKVLRAWFSDAIPASDLPRISGRVVLHPFVHEYEAGPQPYVEAVWQEFLSTPALPLAEVCRAASTQAPLRALLPFTSLLTLCFSQTTGFPFVTGTPKIEAHPTGYAVITPGGDRVTVTSPAEAAEAAASLIPPGIAACHGHAAA